MPLRNGKLIVVCKCAASSAAFGSACYVLHHGAHCTLCEAGNCCADALSAHERLAVPIFQCCNREPSAFHFSTNQTCVCSPTHQYVGHNATPYSACCSPHWKGILTQHHNIHTNIHTNRATTSAATTSWTSVVRLQKPHVHSTADSANSVSATTHVLFLSTHRNVQENQLDGGR